MALVKKITTKEFGNLTIKQLAAKVEDAGGKTFIGRIYGSARRKELVETPHGVSVKFMGEFRGEGFDGVQLVSGVCYLPEVAENALAQVMDDVQGGEDAARVNVEFGFDVFAITDKGATGYKYIVEPLLEVKPSDVVASLAAGFAPLPLAAPAAPAALGHEGGDVEGQEPTQEEAKPSKGGKAK